MEFCSAAKENVGSQGASLTDAALSHAVDQGRAETDESNPTAGTLLWQMPWGPCRQKSQFGL